MDSRGDIIGGSCFLGLYFDLVADQTATQLHLRGILGVELRGGEFLKSGKAVRPYWGGRIGLVSFESKLSPFAENELIGGDAFATEVEVETEQEYQSWSQNQVSHQNETPHNYKTHPQARTIGWVELGWESFLRLERVSGEGVEERALWGDESESEEKEREDEKNEEVVVGGTNAVVEPDTVMVELSHTSVALFTVFRTREHMGVTDLANQMVELGGEGLSLGPRSSLSRHSWVSGIHSTRNYCENDDANKENGE